jgi:hypothetical protein
MLDLMLGHGADAFSCGEVVAWFRPWRAHHFEARQYPSELWKRIGGVPEDRFHSNAASELGVRFIVDSSKDEAWVLDTQRWAKRNGMSVFNLMLWKDPLSHAHSFWKRGASLNQWKKHYIRYYQRMIEAGIPFSSVHFEELVEDPSGKLKAICALVGMPYFEGKERFWEGDHDHLFGSLGTRKQVEEGVSHIRRSQTYEEAFAERRAEVEALIQSDPKVKLVLEHLQRTEVSRGNAAMEVERTGRGIYPLWYYGFRARAAMRTWMPSSRRPMQG